MAGEILITPTGYQTLQDELHRLWHQERPKVVNEVSEAAALGDRSENAEYIYGKKRLREIDRRIRFLSGRIERLKVVDPTAQKSNRVEFGATVTTEDEEGARRVFSIVGEDEVAPKVGWISMQSPIGRALWRKTVGDEVEVQRPAGELYLEIVDIQYRTLTPS